MSHIRSLLPRQPHRFVATAIVVVVAVAVAGVIAVHDRHPSLPLGVTSLRRDYGASTMGPAVAPTIAPTIAPAKVVHDVLASEQFRFCHEPGYPLTPAEKQWCALGAGENARSCPALREVCKHDASAKQLEWSEPFSLRLPELGRPLRLILSIVFGLGLAVLLFALLRHFLDRTPKQDVVTVGSEAPHEDAAAVLARQIETDVQSLLERARVAAQTGDFRAAIGDAYAALLRRLEGARVVRVEPDRTNGDYLSEVGSARPALAPCIAEIVDSVERVQFGNATVTGETFEKVWTGVIGLLAERIGVLVVFSVLLLAGACGQRSDWEYSPSGRAGVVDYLGRRGFKVHERLLSLAKIGEGDVDELIVLPGAQVGDAEWKALKHWVAEQEGSLVVAGGARTLPAWIGMHTVNKQAAQSQSVTLSDADKRRWGELRVLVPEANSLESQSGAVTRLARKQSPYAAERSLGQEKSERQVDKYDEDDKDGKHDEDDEDDERAGRVLVLADDFLFRNASLLLADNAAVLDNLLRDGGTTVELAGDLTGLVSANPVQSVQRGRLGPAMLQLAALLLVFFAAKGARFGRPIETPRVHTRAFAEHVRALGLHYARAHADRHALGFMGAYAIERLRERCGLRVDRGLSGLAEAVATRTGRSVGAVMRLFIEARDAGKGIEPEAGARDLETAAELCKLLDETGGASGRKRIQSHV